MNTPRLRIRVIFLVSWIMGTLFGCMGGGLGMSYNTLSDQSRLAPPEVDGGYRYNISDGTWELAPQPMSENDVEIRHQDNEDHIPVKQ